VIMSNYRSTIAGAVGALGVFLFGAPIALSAATNIVIPQKLLAGMVVAGFLMQGCGLFLAHLFGADAKSVSDLKIQVQQNTDSIRSGDTSMLPKPTSEKP